MAVSESQTIDDVISYTLISIGCVSSLLNIILIVANFKSMMAKLWGRLLLLIQMLHLICCCLDYPKYSTQDTDCKLSALFFNGFFMMANLQTCLLMFAVYMKLREKLQRYFLSVWRYIAHAMIVGCSFGLASWPYAGYEKCKIGTYEAFCGCCFKPGSRYFWVDWAIVLVPSALGLIVSAITAYHIRMLIKCRLLNEQTKTVAYFCLMPFLNIVLIWINTASSLIISNINLSNVDSLLSHLMVFLDQVIYFTALINLVYFIYHTRKGKLFTIRIKRLRWMFCLGIDHQEEERKKLMWCAD